MYYVWMMPLAEGWMKSTALIDIIWWRRHYWWRHMSGLFSPNERRAASPRVEHGWFLQAIGESPIPPCMILTSRTRLHSWWCSIADRGFVSGMKWNFARYPCGRRRTIKHIEGEYRLRDEQFNITHRVDSRRFWCSWHANCWWYWPHEIRLSPQSTSLMCSSLIRRSPGHCLSSNKYLAALNGHAA